MRRKAHEDEAGHVQAAPEGAPIKRHARALHEESNRVSTLRRCTCLETPHLLLSAQTPPHPTQESCTQRSGWLPTQPSREPRGLFSQHEDRNPYFAGDFRLGGAKGLLPITDAWMTSDACEQAGLAVAEGADQRFPATLLTLLDMNAFISSRRFLSSSCRCASFAAIDCSSWRSMRGKSGFGARALCGRPCSARP